MPNNFLETKFLARQALPLLTSNIVMPELCTLDYSNTFQKQGDTIRIQKPTSFEAKKFTRGSQIEKQDIDETSVDVTLDTIRTVDVAIESIQMATNIDSLMRQVIEPAMLSIAEAINADGLAQAKYINNVAGTIGNTPDSIDDLIEVNRLLNVAKAPTADRYAVWDANADAKLKGNGNFTKVNEAGTSQTLRKGIMGETFGIQNYMSQSVYTPEATITAATAVKLSGATTAGTSVTLAIDGTSLTGKLSAGDVISIGGVNYTVAKDTATASSNAISGIEVNEPIQTHADNTNAVLYSGGVNNLAFHKSAIAFVTRPLVAPNGGYTTTNGKYSLRVVRHYDIDTKQEVISIDVLYGYKVIRPELAFRYFG